MISEIFSPKELEEKGAILTQSTAIYAERNDDNIGFQENRLYFRRR
jgi:hypothetical protein